MYNMLLMSIIILILSNMMMLLNLYLTKKLFKNREKSSPFECGFNPMSNSRLPFSIQFYFIAIIFLIFDVEMTLLFPMIKSMMYSMLNYWMMSSLIILFILLIGLYIEWMNNLIKWF